MKQWLTTWLLWLFGVEPPPAGEGTAWQFAGDWGWTPPLVLSAAALAAAAVGLVGALYLTERSEAPRRVRLLLSGIRLSLLLIVALVMLFGLRVMFTRTSLPYLAIVIDDSASMEHVDAFEPAVLEALRQRVARQGDSQPTRINLARSLLRAGEGESLSRLSEQYKLQFYLLAGSTRRQDWEPEEFAERLAEVEAVGGSTRLGEGIRAVLDDLRGTQPAAIVVLSDGINTEGPPLSEAAQQARRRGVPLVLIGIGSETPARHLQLRDLLVERVVFVDDYVDFEFKLEAAGLAGRTVEVVLRREGVPGELARKQVALGDDGAMRELRLSHRPTEEGEFEFVIEIDQPPDGLPQPPRRLSQVVRVEKAQVRVLLAQGYPNYEYRYLKHLLERDPTVELRTVLQEADLEYAADDQYALRVFPVNEEELAEYDVLILGDLNPAYLSRSILENVARFVTERGRGVALLAGPYHNPQDYRDTPLATLLPHDPAGLTAEPPPGISGEGFTVRLAGSGAATSFMQLGDSPEQTRDIWRRLPPLYWLHEARQLKPGVRVLAEHASAVDDEGRPLPLVALHFVPPGKVLWHATDETYRWRQDVGDVYFARYWVQAIRYLARSKFADEHLDVELVADRSWYRRGDPVQLRVRFFDERLVPQADDGVAVMIEAEGRQRQRLPLARDPQNRAIFSGRAANLPGGDYRAWVVVPPLDSPAAAEFSVRPPAGETDVTQMDTAELKQAAEIARGRYYHIAELESLPPDLPQGRAVKVESLPPIELWNHWRMLVLFLGLLVTEWLLRKRYGMM